MPVIAGGAIVAWVAAVAPVIAAEVSEELLLFKRSRLFQLEA